MGTARRGRRRAERSTRVTGRTSAGSTNRRGRSRSTCASTRTASSTAAGVRPTIRSPLCAWGAHADTRVMNGAGEDDVAALVAAAEADAEARRWDSALHKLDEAIALNPENADAWSERSRMLANLERFEEAL